MNYPSIESLVISCFIKNSTSINIKSNEIKLFLDINKLDQHRIFDNEMLNGCKELINAIYLLVNHKISPEDFDNFYNINFDIFNFQEHYFELNKMYSLLSLFFISFLDLGLIVIE